MNDAPEWALYFVQQGFRHSTAPTATGRSLCPSVAEDLAELCAKLPSRFTSEFDYRFATTYGFSTEDLSSEFALVRQVLEPRFSNALQRWLEAFVVPTVRLPEPDFGLPSQLPETAAAAAAAMWADADEALRVGHAWRESAERDASVARWLAAPSPSLARVVIATAIEKLFKSRFAELSFPIPAGSSLHALCRALTSQGVSCEGYRAQEFDVADVNKLLERFTALTRVFSTVPDPVVLKQKLSRACTRQVVSTGISPVIKNLHVEQPHRYKKITRLVQDHGRSGDVLDAMLADDAPVEVWLGPTPLVLRCLTRLGYGGVHSVPGRVSHSGARPWLIPGIELSNVYHLELRYRLARGERERAASDLTVLLPASDSDTWYSDIAELWYFYFVGAYQPAPADIAFVGYRGEGSGAHFEEYIRRRRAKDACPFARENLPAGALISFRDSRKARRKILFLDGGVYDGTTAAPSFFLGQVLGRHKLPALYNTGSAGGLTDELEQAAVFVPKDFTGWRMDLNLSRMSAAPKLLRNDAYQRVANSPHRASVVLGGRLGAIFQSSMEFQDFEESLKLLNELSAFDMDSFYLFSGYRSANAQGKIHGVYRIHDRSAKLQAELNDAQKRLYDARWQHTAGKEEWEANSAVTQELFSMLFDFAQPVCAQERRCAWNTPNIPDGNLSFGWRHIVARHLEGGGRASEPDQFVGSPSRKELEEAARAIARPENLCSVACDDVLTFNARTTIAGTTENYRLRLERQSGVVRSISPLRKRSMCSVRGR